jgi:hypothetical protein
MHGLPHWYVHERYEALTGWRVPAAGGPSTRGWHRCSGCRTSSPVNKSVATLGQFTVGSTFFAGTGDFRFGLPVAAASGEGNRLGSALILDLGTRLYTGVTFIPDGASYANIYADQAIVTFTAPFCLGYWRRVPP